MNEELENFLDDETIDMETKLYRVCITPTDLEKAGIDTKNTEYIDVKDIYDINDDFQEYYSYEDE